MLGVVALLTPKRRRRGIRKGKDVSERALRVYRPETHVAHYGAAVRPLCAPAPDNTYTRTQVQ